jgi:MFS family permease
MKPGSVWTALRNKPVQRLWIASLISGSAVSAHTLAAAWALNALGSSKFLISLVPGLVSLAFLLFTLPAGVLADFFDRRRVMICANLWLFTTTGSLAMLAFLNRLSPVAILRDLAFYGVSKLNIPDRVRRLFQETGNSSVSLGSYPHGPKD